MNATLPNVIWKTPEEVDADRLAADYRRLDAGGWVTQLSCVLGCAAPPDRGHRVIPPPLEDENEV